MLTFGSVVLIALAVIAGVSFAMWEQRRDERIWREERALSFWQRLGREAWRNPIAAVIGVLLSIGLVLGAVAAATGHWKEVELVIGGLMGILILVAFVAG
jgi:hypothetical protein